MDNDEKNILCIYSDKYFLCSEYIRINKMSHTRYHDDEVRIANQVETKEITFPNAQPFVEESRASHPAWMYRDLEHPIWETPILNPQANLEKPFHDNIQTRTLEKDNYRPNLIPTDQSGK